MGLETNHFDTFTSCLYMLEWGGVMGSLEFMDLFPVPVIWCMPRCLSASAFSCETIGKNSLKLGKRSSADKMFKAVQTAFIMYIKTARLTLLNQKTINAHPNTDYIFYYIWGTY